MVKNMQQEVEKRGNRDEIMSNLYEYLSNETNLPRRRIEKILETGSLKGLSETEKDAFLRGISSFLEDVLRRKTGLRILSSFIGDSKYGELIVKLIVSLNRFTYLVELNSDIVVVDDQIRFRGEYFERWLKRTIDESIKSTKSLLTVLKKGERYRKLVKEGITGTERVALIHFHFIDYTEPYPVIIPNNIGEKRLQEMVDEAVKELNKKYGNEWGFGELITKLKERGIKPIPIYDDLHVDVPK